jgi:hypothetical protein
MGWKGTKGGAINLPMRIQVIHQGRVGLSVSNRRILVVGLVPSYLAIEAQAGRA